MRFDLVLLLDLSGSNEKKLKMIRNSANALSRLRVRPIVWLWFHLPVTGALFIFHAGSDEAEKSIGEMDDAFGGTNFWDALDWVVRVLIPQGSGRRSAVVVMTDGVDNALPDVKGDALASRLIRCWKVSATQKRSSSRYTSIRKKNWPRVPRSAYALARTACADL